MSLLQMSVSGAAMILAIVVIRALAINRLPKKTFIVLWGIVLLRLLVPFSFPSPFSAYSLVNQHIFTPQEAVGLGNANVIPVPPVDLPTTGDVVIQGQTPADIPPYAIAWGIGLTVCVLFFAISYLKCRREFRESLPIKNDFLTRWVAEHKLSRPIEIRQSSRISAPLTYGVFKPIILMPRSTRWDDTKEIEYILAHEFVHIRRFDAAVKLLLTAALCIHWFNPLVWAMYILSNRDIELSCDETVVRFFGETAKSPYALTLIGMEEKKSTLTPLCNSFSKNAIEERITAIMKLKKTSIAATLVAFSLIIGVTTAFATSAKALSNSDSPTTVRDDQDPPGTREDYQALLSLQTPDYQSQSVATMNHAILEFCKDNDDASERIRKDIAMNDYRVTLTKEEKAFVAQTFMYSVAQNRAENKNLKYPGLQYTLNASDDPTVWLMYGISFDIPDINTLTVKERDLYLSNVINGMQTFWNEKSSDKLASVKEETFRTQLNSLAKKNSNSLISIKIDDVSFQAAEKEHTQTISDKDIAAGGKISLGPQLLGVGTDCKVLLTFTGDNKLTVLCASANGATKSLSVESGKAAALKIDADGEYTISIKNDNSQAISNVNGTIEFMQSSGSQNSNIPSTLNASTSQAVTYSNVEMRHYEGTDGHPYIHDTKVNETTKKITGYKYGMLAFDKAGNPLKIDWWSVDTDAKSTYFYMDEASTEIAPSDTNDIIGGWSLNFYGTDLSVEQIAYVLYCDKEITFEDGTIWTNPHFDSWRSTYEGKKVDVNILKGYYPYEQTINFAQ